MGRALRFIPSPDTIVEVTNRTRGGRYLLTPFAEFNELLLGVIGRAMSLCPYIELFMLVIMSGMIRGDGRK